MLTVMECLGLPQLESMRLYGGSEGVTREVHFSHAVEEPDVGAWIKPGLLALTTGHPFHDDESARAWLESLDNHGAAGIVIALGRYLTHVPETMLEAANRRHIPLIVAPWDLPFLSITSAIHGRIIDLQTAALRRLSDIQQRVTEAALSAQSQEDLLTRISKITERDIVLTSSHASSRRSLPLPSLPGRALAWPTDTTDSVDRQVGHQVALVTSLYLLREQIRQQMDWDARSQFISRFLEESHPTPLRSWEEHQPWSLHPDHAHVVCAITIPGETQPTATRSRSALYEFRRAVWEALSDLKPFLTISEPHNMLIAVLDAEGHDAITLDQRLQTILHEFPKESAIIGDAGAPEELAATYRALIQLKPFAQPKEVTYARSMLYPLLVSTLPDPAMELLYSLTWGRIDDEKLQDTLGVWIEEGGHSAPALRRLGIHRNTLKNRLDRIEEQLGMKLTPTLLAQLQITYDWSRASASRQSKAT